MRFLLLLVVLSVGLLGVAPADRVSVQFVIRKSGCGASEPGKPIYLSFWHANEYPGLGDEVLRLQSTGTIITRMAPGYYRVMVSSYRCWEEADWFVLLPQRPRTVYLDFSSFVAKRGDDYDVYYTPRGAIAGVVPHSARRVKIIQLTTAPGPKVPVLKSLDAMLKRYPTPPIKTSSAWTIFVENGAYYDPALPPGTYEVRVIGADGVLSQKQAIVRADHLTQIDF